MRQSRGLPRRTALKAGAAAAALPLVHIRTAGAAGKLKVAFVDHYVPGASDAMRQLVELWGEKTRTAVQVDFIAGGDKYLLTLAAEAQSRSGHDIVMPSDWLVPTYADQLEPMDDIVDHLSARHGPLAPVFAYFGKVDGGWRCVPASYLTLLWPSETRIDLFQQHVGMDVRTVFPAAGEMGAGYEQWTWDAFLIAAERCFKAGYPFGLPMGKTGDSAFWVGALFHSFGAELVDANGTITAKSDNVRKVLDYAKRLMPFLPPEVYSWDNLSNNKALISGKSALIFNPPSAWAVALRDNPTVGEQIWHHPLPAGEHGRFVPFDPEFYGVWAFGRNKSAAKELITWLCEREQVEKLCIASRGYDVPPFISMTDFPVWAEEGPPKGTLFNYPLRPGHQAALSVPATPAPPSIASQITYQATMPKMIARVTQSGMSIEQSIVLAEQELEGFMR